MSAKDRARESNRQRLIIGNNYGKDASAAKRISHLEIDAQTFGAGDNPSFGEIVLAPGTGGTPGPTPPLPSTAYRGFIIIANAATTLEPKQRWAVTSYDKGLTWNYAKIGGWNRSLWGISSGPGGANNKSVAINMVEGNIGFISYSITRDSGLTWTDTNSVSTGVAFPGRVFIANDNAGTWVLGGLYSSVNNLANLVSNNLSTGTHNFIGANENGEWRAVTSGTNGIRTSTNGTVWATDSSITLPSAVRHGVYAGNGRFIVVGESGIIAFADGYDQPWVNLGSTISPNRLNGVASNKNGVVVAVGDNGQIVRSTNNGTNWSNLGTPGPSDFVSVASDEGAVFVAMTDTGVLFRSTDFGATWSSSGNILSAIPADTASTFLWAMAPIL